MRLPPNGAPALKYFDRPAASSVISPKLALRNFDSARACVSGQAESTSIGDAIGLLAT